MSGQLLLQLDPPEYSSDEQELILSFLMALTSKQIGEFLARHELPTTGTKDELRERVQAALAGGGIRYTDIVVFVDTIAPWGKQHVYLYNGPIHSIRNWKNTAWVKKKLGQVRLARLFNATLPLILPKKMKISSIEHNGEVLRIVAVERRDNWERDDELDDYSQVDGEPAYQVHFRAWVNRIMRGLLIFEWNLVSNTAQLRITQLPSRQSYEKKKEEFEEHVSSWIPIDTFTLVDIRPAIKRLHEAEVTGKAETTSHAIAYKSRGGRRVDAASASQHLPLPGDPLVDRALEPLRRNGLGHSGNFYWLPASESAIGQNPLEYRVHVIMVGAHQRINFTVANPREVIEHVLSRIRALSR